MSVVEEPAMKNSLVIGTAAVLLAGGVVLWAADRDRPAQPPKGVGQAAPPGGFPGAPPGGQPPGGVQGFAGGPPGGGAQGFPGGRPPGGGMVGQPPMGFAGAAGAVGAFGG